jgi:hypothetical protein
MYFNFIIYCQMSINKKPGFWFSYRYFRIDLFEFEKVENPLNIL